MMYLVQNLRILHTKQIQKKKEMIIQINIVIDWVPENRIRSLAKWIYGKLELMFFFIFCQIYAKFEKFSKLKLLINL